MSVRRIRDKFDLISQPSSRDELRPNLTAFLAISRGIIDHLLEEYNMKFGLNILLDTKLFIKTFKEAVESQNKQTALGFVKSYESEFNTLASTAVGGLLIGKRNVVIHRTETSLHGKFSVNIPESINLEEKVSIVKTNRDGKIIQESQSFNPQQTKRKDEDVLSPSKVEVKWFFSDYPRKEIVDICGEFLDLVRDFVDNMYNKFP